MNVKVLLFAHLKEMAGSGTLSLNLPEDASGEQLLDQLVEIFPEAKNLRGFLRLSMNGEYITPENTILENSEVAVFPPVSGGA